MIWFILLAILIKVCTMGIVIVLVLVFILICGVRQYNMNKKTKIEKETPQYKYMKESECLNDEAVKLSKTLFFDKLLQAIKQAALKEADREYYLKENDGYTKWCRHFSIYAYTYRCVMENDYDGPNLSVNYRDLDTGIEKITEHDAKVLQRALFNTGLFICCTDYGRLEFKDGLFKDDFELILKRYNQKQEQLHNNLYK